MTNNQFQPNGQNDQQSWSYQEQPPATQPTAAPYVSTGDQQSWDPYPTTARPNQAPIGAAYTDPYAQPTASYTDPYAQQGNSYVPTTQGQVYGYQSSAYAQPAANVQAPVMSVTDWVVTALITAIPVVGFVMLLMWAFSKTENPNRTNWAKANLIILGIAVAIWLVLVILIFGIIGMSIR